MVPRRLTPTTFSAPSRFRCCLIFWPTPVASRSATLNGVQNIENQRWDLSDVNDKLHRKMTAAVDTVVDKRTELLGAPPPLAAPDDAEAPQNPECIDLRTAALVSAIQRTAHVALERGIWP